MSVRSLPPQSSAGVRRHAAEGVSIFDGFFVLFVVELLLMGGVVWSFVVLRSSYPNSQTDLSGRLSVMAGIAVAIIGTVCLYLSGRSLKRVNWRLGRNYLACVVVFAAVLMGILLNTLTGNLIAAETVVDLRDSFRSRRGPAASAPTASKATGDAANGKKWFAMSCVTCHGPTGDGMPNAAPSLRASQFLKSADDVAVAALIRNGRAIGDPANKSGKVMPAKGGNPFLDDAKIADLVAFVKSLGGNGAPTGASGTAAPGAAGPIGSAAAANQNLRASPAAIVHEWTSKELADLPRASEEQAETTGAQAFVKANCVRCHVPSSNGPQAKRPQGPALDQIVRKYRADQMLIHLLEPSREVDKLYRAECILLQDGRRLNGVVASETDSAICLIPCLLEPDQQVTILKEQIETRAPSPVSPMPTGLLNVLQKDEISALVGYIESAGKKLASLNAPQISHWVVPAGANGDPTNRLSASKSALLHTREDELNKSDASRYRQGLLFLFLLATATLVFHFLWVAGAGTGMILHDALGLAARTQLQLARCVACYWSFGIVWFGTWVWMFFMVR